VIRTKDRALLTRYQQSKIPDDIDLPMQKEDFRRVATKLEASRDIGAQLFCALLRSASVETRLVCSLQVLPFVPTVKGTTPVKPKPAFTVEYPDTRTGFTDDESGADAGSDSPARPAGSSSVSGLTNRPRLRLGGPGRLRQIAPVMSSPIVAPPVKRSYSKRRPLLPELTSFRGLPKTNSRIPQTCVLG